LHHGSNDGYAASLPEREQKVRPGAVTRAKRLPWFFENHRAHVDLSTRPVQKSEIQNKFEARNAIRLRRIEILRDLWRFGFY